jgi:hypothetical protein
MAEAAQFTERRGCRGIRRVGARAGAVDSAARWPDPDGHVVVVHIATRDPDRDSALVDGLALGDEDLLDTNWSAEMVDGPPHGDAQQTEDP